jgi:Cu/Ag efflux pump CusA
MRRTCNAALPPAMSISCVIRAVRGAAVARLFRRFVALIALQWIPLLLMIMMPRGSFAANAVALALVGAFVVSMVMTPITGDKLVNRLDVESPVRLAALMYSPLFSLLPVPLVAAYARRWGRRREIEMGMAGPTRSGMERLRQRG